MKIWFPISIGALVGLFSWAHATSFIEKSFPDAVSEAPVIVRGTVGMSYSDYGRTPGDEKRLYTYYELVPSEVFKGTVPDGAIMMRQIGGSKDGVTMEVPGTAHFSRGEEIVVMLGAQGSDGSFDVRSLMMGKFTIDRINGKEYLNGPGAVSPEDARDTEVIHPEDGVRRKKPATYTLESLRELVRSGAKDSDPVTTTILSTPFPSPIGTTAPKSSVTQPTAAPGLQNPLQGETAEPSGEGEGTRKWVWGVILVGSWLLIRTLRRRSR